MGKDNNNAQGAADQNSAEANDDVTAGHGPGFDKQDDLPEGDFHSYTDRTVERDDES